MDNFFQKPRGEKGEAKAAVYSYYHSFTFLFTSSNVQANTEGNETPSPLSPQELVDAQLKTMDLTELKQYWEDVQSKYGDFFLKAKKGVYMIS